jgi:hypothetical protein
MSKSKKFSWALDLKRDGASTCILLGSIPSKELKKFKKYKSIIWIAAKEECNSNMKLDNIKQYQLNKLVPETLDSLINNFLISSFSSLPDIYISNSVLSKHTQSYNYVMDKIHLHCQNMHRSRETRKEEGFISQLNTINNLLDYACNRVTDQTFKSLNNTAVAIVGAGPSLEASINILSTYRDKIIILAVDSALKNLHAEGISPDGTVSIDAQKLCKSNIPEGMNPGLLFLSTKSPRDWSLNGNHTIFLSSNSLTEDWLAKEGLEKSSINCIANCGVTALNIAINLNLSPILLFGMDHAIDTSGSGHAKGVDLTAARGSEHNPEGQHPEVPGNYSNNVRTFLKGELHEMNELLGNRQKELMVYNITDRGAKLQNTILKHPDEFDIIIPNKRHPSLIDSLKNKNPDKEEAMRFIQSQTRRIQPNLIKSLKQTDSIRQSLMQVYQDKRLSGLLGNLSLLHLPMLIEWDNIEDIEKKKMLDEVVEALNLLIDI